MNLAANFVSTQNGVVSMQSSKFYSSSGQLYEATTRIILDTVKWLLDQGYSGDLTFCVVHHMLCVNTVLCDRIRTEIFCDRISSAQLFKVKTNILFALKNFAVWPR